MDKKRLMIGVITGAILGIFCIVGVGWRIGYSGNEMFLFAMWYNRVIMGLLIGFASGLEIINSKYNFFVRGLLLGTLVSLAITFTSDFRDIPSLFAGIGYGVIIDYVCTRFS